MVHRIPKNSIWCALLAVKLEQLLRMCRVQSFNRISRPHAYWNLCRLCCQLLLQEVSLFKLGLRKIDLREREQEKFNWQRDSTTKPPLSLSQSAAKANAITTFSRFSIAYAQVAQLGAMMVELPGCLGGAGGFDASSMAWVVALLLYSCCERNQLELLTAAATAQSERKREKDSFFLSLSRFLHGVAWVL